MSQASVGRGSQVALAVCLLGLASSACGKGKPPAPPVVAKSAGEKGVPMQELTNVTMTEAVEVLRQRGVWLHLEREPLGEADVDRSRPIVDARRRFSATLPVGAAVEPCLDAVIKADPAYDWVQLTKAPASYLIFPRGNSKERFGHALLARKAEKIATRGRPLAEVVGDLVRKADITVFDRPGFLAQAQPLSDVPTQGRPLYQVLGELFAASGKPLVFTLAGLGSARVLSIGSLPVVPGSSAAQ